ncbi:Uncharacterised protein [[Clostridium] sordellii]|uniref:Uncharacterized protein n=2 Tax=Paraclostridium sordellii TaxID=1505 RepID=A0A0C7L1Z3_PARSO|nr:Uncharacterised protein [[Clostridium] sordellii] [Paeniclostridium sordellii]CEP41417.1 Uncharacterised protein [[Clostridium] sordellii] [Paeniclostridium sordellii]
MYMSKKKLTLSIDEKLIRTIKHIAVDNETNISEMFEDYIRAINKNKNTLRAIQDMTK